MDLVKIVQFVMSSANCCLSVDFSSSSRMLAKLSEQSE